MSYSILTEFDWFELLKEIAKTVHRKKFTDQQIAALPDKEKKKLISENVVRLTLHFQKPIEKKFSLMVYNFLMMVLDPTNIEVHPMCILFYG